MVFLPLLVLQGMCVVNGAMKRHEEAVKCGLAVLELNPGSHRAMSAVSWEYFIMGNLEKALELTLESIRLQDNVAVYYYRLGAIYWAMDGTKVNVS